MAALGEAALVGLLGRAAGRQLHALSHNRDPRRVVVGRRRRSMGAQAAIGRRPRTHAELEAILAALVDRVTRRLRAAHRVGHTVTVRLRFYDYRTRATRPTVPMPRSRSFPDVTGPTPHSASTGSGCRNSSSPSGR